MIAEYPWSGGALKRLSRHIRDETPASSNHPSYADVMLWFNDLAARVQTEISSLNWPPLLLDRPFEVTSRPKTIDTLRQKLRRDPSTPLPSVQDIAGVRFEAEMSLDEQDAVATAVCGLYSQEPAEAIKDMRSHDHSGYRAVHVWLRLPARVEVQIRTHLQGEWANTYEAAADVFGRTIRYDELPGDDLARRIVTGLRDISTNRIVQIEKDRNEIARIGLALEEDRRRGWEMSRDAEDRLDILRERGLRNERQLQTDLTKLRRAFTDLRNATRDKGQG